MKYLKLFETDAEYQTFKQTDEFIKPNVSHCVQENEVHYNKLSWANEYLTFDILSPGTIVWKTQTSASSARTISYSINGGEWNEITSSYNGESFNVNVGDKVRFKGNNTAYNLSPGNSQSNLFSASTSSFNIEGNIMSLISGDSFIDASTIQSNGTFQALFAGTKVVNAKNLILPPITMKKYTYSNMFSGCTSLITAPELPATTLAESCYNGMFKGCVSLTIAPELPATTAEWTCYSNMFSGCTSLTTAPVLPATVLKTECYGRMFAGCTSLTAAPELPATTLADYCYTTMFSGCTSLTEAPELPATTLTSRCYGNMFNGCASLNYIKAMFTTTPSTAYTSDWVNGVAATGTFVKNAAATWTTTGANGIPTGWTVETATA